ncbi:isochorismate synthase [Marinomonas balearica]|uniref:isochorismate synthase n=1 Tax=Marinomonas balearica TaxID=491947 RepID=A0A4R6MBQ8_9GAMM|nr:isochorismate synthase [Marinomonas balearica]TDO98904.1 isochorismate synthase [Marinomonas balearica]
MDTLVSGYSKSASITASAPFLFYSNSSSVRCKGAKKVLERPLADPLFTQHLDELFTAEKALGVENPIVVGAIPFDLEQPTHLIVPEWFTFQSVPSFDMSLFNDRSFKHKVRAHQFFPEHDAFIHGVNQAHTLFGDTELKKVVLSRLLELELDQPVDLSRLMGNVMAQNPNAYHFNLPIREGVLIGASPELLIRKTADKVYSNPLAGSAKRQCHEEADVAAADGLWNSTKDQYEHRLVVDSIRSSIARYVGSKVIPDTPSLINTPTMWHLSTQIEGRLRDSNTSIFELIRSIHPTPAMGGTPSKLAKQVIDDVEPHDRCFFSGLVGWADSQGNGEWAIAIRCAEVKGAFVRLFAGAGIVPQSDPEMEWIETGNKMQTMLNAFGIERSAL